MRTFTKKAWEFVVGETLVGEDGSQFRIVGRERKTEEGVGAYVGLSLVRVDLEVEDGAEVDVHYARFEPFAEFTGVSGVNSEH